MFKNIILLFFICGLTALTAQDFESNVSKRATVAAPFLNISQGARASAMGSAFVAVASDPSAMFWNVAGIARLENNGILFDHTEWIADLGYNFVAASYNLSGFGAIGLSIIASDYGEMNVTTVDEPNGTGETFTVSDLAVGLGWATNLTDNFSIGFVGKVVYQSIWRMNDLAFAGDLGILYNTPFDGIVLGMSITNFGSKMEMQGTNSVVLYDADEESTGNNGNIPAELSTDSWDLPLNFRVGVSYKNVVAEMHSFTIALDAMHPNNDYESINVGLEYEFNRIFALRGGYKSLFLDETEESFSFGAGFRQLIIGNVNIQVDYSYGDFGRLKETQKFSIGVNF